MLISPKPSRRARSGRPGATVVELAVLLPFLTFLFVIATDWARLLYFSIEVNECARSGALYASDATYSGQSRYATVTDAAMAEAADLVATATVT